MRKVKISIPLLTGVDRGKRDERKVETNFLKQAFAKKVMKTERKVINTTQEGDN